MSPELAILRQLHAGSTLASKFGSEQHGDFLSLEKSGLVRCAGHNQKVGLAYWDISRKGAMLVLSSLGPELSRRMQNLLQDYSAEKATEVGEWIEANFRLAKSPRTLKGTKELREIASRMVWSLKFRLLTSSAYQNGTTEQKVQAIESARQEVALDWGKIAPKIDLFIASFTDEVRESAPKEMVVNGILYTNEIDLTPVTLGKYIKRLDAVFQKLKGWRTKALQGQLKVVLAKPDHFRGTVTGKYKRNEDALYIRATPKVLKRDAGYGGVEYIIIHELGHRYERYHKLPEDFDRPAWWTTRYSRQEGESFAELFALSHFRLTGSWDLAVVERFDDRMK